MKNFQSEVVHSNRRRGCDSVAWGALAAAAGGFWAVIPRAPGDWHRIRVTDQRFETADEASKVAKASMRGPANEQQEHLNGSGGICLCRRGVLLSQA